MKREIRIWDGKRMIYTKGDPFYDNLCIGLDGKIYNVGDSSGDGGWCYEEEEYIRMDGTGLKDKNGKEIYEGDVLRSKDKKEYQIRVRYSELDLGFTTDTFRLDENEDGEEYWKEDYHNHSLRGIMTYDYEVIGNIYQNPELVENSTPTDEKMV